MLGSVKKEEDLIAALVDLYGEGNRSLLTGWVNEMESQEDTTWTLHDVYRFVLDYKRKGKIVPFTGVDLGIHAKGLDGPLLPHSDKQKSKDGDEQRQRRQAIKNFAFNTVTTLIGVVDTTKFETRNLTTEKLHAEQDFVRQAEPLIKKLKNPRIVITINNSPCADRCALFLANWVKEHNLTNVTIYFANPYGTDEEFREAVGILQGAGITVAPFSVLDYTGEDTDDEMGEDAVQKFKEMSYKSSKYQQSGLFKSKKSHDEYDSKEQDIVMEEERVDPKVLHQSVLDEASRIGVDQFYDIGYADGTDHNCSILSVFSAAGVPISAEQAIIYRQQLAQTNNISLNGDIDLERHNLAQALLQLVTNVTNIGYTLYVVQEDARDEDEGGQHLVTPVAQTGNGGRPIFVFFAGTHFSPAWHQ